MALLGLVEKHGDGDFMREVGEWFLQRLTEFEAAVQRRQYPVSLAHPARPALS